VPPPSADSDIADKDGITDSMLDFSWDRDVEMSVSLDSNDDLYKSVFLMMIYLFLVYRH
jgi:template-activating factor I